jgi:hypothetical protein
VNGLSKPFLAAGSVSRAELYMPIAWYPESTYSVVPVTLAASSESR